MSLVARRPRLHQIGPAIGTSVMTLAANTATVIVSAMTGRTLLLRKVLAYNPNAAAATIQFGESVGGVFAGRVPMVALPGGVPGGVPVRLSEEQLPAFEFTRDLMVQADSANVEVSVETESNVGGPTMRPRRFRQGVRRSLSAPYGNVGPTTSVLVDALVGIVNAFPLWWQTVGRTCVVRKALLTNPSLTTVRVQIGATGTTGSLGGIPVAQVTPIFPTFVIPTLDVLALTEDDLPAVEVNSNIYWRALDVPAGGGTAYTLGLIEVEEFVA